MLFRQNRHEANARRLGETLSPIASRRNSHETQKPVGEMTLRRKADGQSNVGYWGISVRQQIPGFLNAASKDKLMWRLTDGSLKGAWQVKWTDLSFCRYHLEAEIAVEIFLDEIN